MVHSVSSIEQDTELQNSSSSGSSGSSSGGGGSGSRYTYVLRLMIVHLLMSPVHENNNHHFSWRTYNALGIV